MDKRFVETERGRVYYWIHHSPGDAVDCIFFLHGLTANHTLFDKQVEHFAQSHTVITWDAPLHGESRPYSNFSYRNAANDLKAILDAECQAQAIMVGQSMGGYIIQALAIAYPEMIKAFIGIDTCPFGTKYYSKSDLWWLRQIGWMSMCYPYKLLIYSIAKSATFTNDSFLNMKACLESFASKKELCDTMDIGYKCFARENRDVKLNFPTLIIVGEHDKTGKVLHYCKSWHESEKYPLHIVENAAHNSNYDNPKKVNAIIDSFITSYLHKEKS